MTSQPEDKFVELAQLESNYTSIYRSSFGINPPSGTGGGHSPSDNHGEIGMKGLAEGRVDEEDLRLHGLSVGKMAEGTSDGGKVEQVSPETVGPSTEESNEISAEGTEQDQSGASPHVRQDIVDVDRDEDSEDESEDDSQDENTEDDSEDDADYDEESDYEPRHQGPERNRENIQYIGELLRHPLVKNVVVLAGAGISTSAGIPDFRSPKTGLYANLQKFDLPVPEAIFDIGFFKRKPEPFYVLCKDLYPGKHLVRRFHPGSFGKGICVADNGTIGISLPLHIISSVDTLERISGVPSEKIVEAHGSFATSHCIGCRAEVGEEQMKEEIRVNEGRPVRCKKCGDLVKPDIVFFGEGLPERFFKLAMKDLPKCDLLIVVGTSLKVHPFASLISEVSPSCPRLLINREAVGEAENKWDEDGFRFETGSRDRFYEGDADAGARDLAKALDWEPELDHLMSGHHAELRSRWGLAELSTEKTAATSSSDVETMDKLAEDLKKAGIGGHL